MSIDNYGTGFCYLFEEEGVGLHMFQFTIAAVDHVTIKKDTIRGLPPYFCNQARIVCTKIYHG